MSSGLRVVIEVRSPGLTDEADVIRALKAIDAEGSPSHPAYTELIGFTHRLLVEITGVIRVMGGLQADEDVFTPLDKL